MRAQLFATYSGLPSALAIVTSPSRSADIEKRLVFGVHGLEQDGKRADGWTADCSGQ